MDKSYRDEAFRQLSLLNKGVLLQIDDIRDVSESNPKGFSVRQVEEIELALDTLSNVYSQLMIEDLACPVCYKLSTVLLKQVYEICYMAVVYKKIFRYEGPFETFQDKINLLIEKGFVFDGFFSDIEKPVIENLVNCFRSVFMKTLMNLYLYKNKFSDLSVYERLSNRDFEDQDQAIEDFSVLVKIVEENNISV